MNLFLEGFLFDTQRSCVHYTRIVHKRRGVMMYGEADGTPYGEWSTDALSRLYMDLGRNGRLSEDQERIEREVKDLLEERGVDVTTLSMPA